MYVLLFLSSEENEEKENGLSEMLCIDIRTHSGQILGEKKRRKKRNMIFPKVKDSKEEEGFQMGSFYIFILIEFSL